MQLRETDDQFSPRSTHARAQICANCLWLYAHIITMRVQSQLQIASYARGRDGKPPNGSRPIVYRRCCGDRNHILPVRRDAS